MSASGPYAALFEPFVVGGRIARNRIVHAPMSVCYGDLDGYVTDRQVDHYARRAAGGVGMSVTENFAVNEAGRQLPRQNLVCDPKHLPGLHALATGIKENGALALVQLSHAGRYAGPWDVYDQARRLAPSAVPFELTPGRIETPAEMTEAEIAETIAAFGEAASLCEQAGFDGVDLHAAQGLLLSQFLSPRMNRRKDRWGGPFENRVRLLLDVVREVRRRTDPEFIVAVHLLSDELLPGGWTIAESIRLAPLLEAEDVSSICPRAATYESLRKPPNVGLYGRPRHGLPHATALVRASEIPIVANGGLGDPADAAAALRRGGAAAVALARPLFADPDWAVRVAAGRPEEIRRCPCDPPVCARTQITGSVCTAWPQEFIDRGYVGTTMTSPVD